MSSLKEQLRGARHAAQHAKTEEFAIPGYGNRLWGTFKALDDYKDVRKIIKRHEAIEDEADRELYVACDTLVQACEGCFAVLSDGSREDLGVKLGMPLAAYLEFDGAENDRQGVLLVFPNTMSVMTLFAEYDQWMKGKQRETEKELSGKSEAPS